jgi:hypothetical protein
MFPPLGDYDQPRTSGPSLQPQEPAVLAAVTLQHRWVDRSPRVLYGKQLRVCYRLLIGGIVTLELVGIDDPTGNPIRAPRRTFKGMCWDEIQAHGGRDGTGRPVVLAVSAPDDAEAALLSWLEDVGLLLGDD